MADPGAPGSSDPGAFPVYGGAYRHRPMTPPALRPRSLAPPPSRRARPPRPDGRPVPVADNPAARSLLRQLVGEPVGVRVPAERVPHGRRGSPRRNGAAVVVPARRPKQAWRAGAFPGRGRPPCVCARTISCASARERLPGVADVLRQPVSPSGRRGAHMPQTVMVRPSRLPPAARSSPPGALSEPRSKTTGCPASDPQRSMEPAICSRPFCRLQAAAQQLAFHHELPPPLPLRPEQQQVRHAARIPARPGPRRSRSADNACSSNRGPASRYRNRPIHGSISFAGNRCRSGGPPRRYGGGWRASPFPHRGLPSVRLRIGLHAAEFARRPPFGRSRNASSTEVSPVCRGAWRTKYFCCRTGNRISSRSHRSGSPWRKQGGHRDRRGARRTRRESGGISGRIPTDSQRRAKRSAGMSSPINCRPALSTGCRRRDAVAVGGTTGPAVLKKRIAPICRPASEGASPSCVPPSIRPSEDRRWSLRVPGTAEPNAPPGAGSGRRPPAAGRIRPCPQPPSSAPVAGSRTGAPGTVRLAGWIGSAPKTAR